MSKIIAILFPGQGSQYIGMLKPLLSCYPRFQDLVKQAEEISGLPLQLVISEGPSSLLSSTNYTQPAIVLTSLMHWSLVREKFPNLNQSKLVMAGHSIGEYSALCAAGYLSFEQVIKLACIRGRIMAEEGIKNPGAMAVIIFRNPPMDISKEASKFQDVYGEEYKFDISAINGPNQITISGLETEIDRLIENRRSQDNREFILSKLKNISCAFHSRYMNNASLIFKEESSEILKSIHQNNHSVISNVSAQPFKLNSIPELLVSQISKPVQWKSTIEYLFNIGCNDFLPLGPGNVLHGLLKGYHPVMNINIMKYDQSP